MSPKAVSPVGTTKRKYIFSPCICIRVMFLMKVQRNAISCLMLSIHIFGKIKVPPPPVVIFSVYEMLKVACTVCRL
jgi:hypothetical protein